MYKKKTYNQNKREYKKPFLNVEDRVEQFIIRNSKNGFFTRISTISSKFEISEEETWTIVGALLTKGTLESTHDLYSGEMKLCKTDEGKNIRGKKSQKRYKQSPKKTHKK